VKAANESLPQNLVDSFRLLGLTESEYQQSNRLKTAAEAKKLLTALELKKPTDLVHDLASYPLTTTPLHLSKSLKSAQSVLDAIGSTHWELFKAVSQIQDNRKALAENLMAEVSQSMMNDEFALANGLAVKLKEAVNTAIKLLTPISPPTPPPISPPTPPPISPPTPPPISPPTPTPPPTPDPKWKRLKEGKKERVALDQFQLDLEEIKKQVDANPKCKITFDWYLEEEQSL
jgi:NAD-dependent DNA ligase